jgi:uncharacterized protein (DUF1697 family)
MARYAAFLRAVNLGPTRKAGSAQLRSLFEELGFEDVATFRTSGNVVFDAGRESAAKLTERIEKGLAEGLGFDVTILLRTASEVRAIAEHQPFPSEALEASEGKLQVVMLQRKPGKEQQKEVEALAADDDSLDFRDRELYWLPRGGIRDADLNRGAMEKVFGPTTTRTKGTVELIAAKFFY